MTPGIQRSTWLLVGSILLTVAIYWPGLSGPFLFDDRFNFSIIQEWLAGEASLAHAIFGHQSILVSRPVAMASFVANAALGGDDAFFFKLGNLLVHAACGIAAFYLFRTLLRQSGAKMGAIGAAVAVAVWLLHPLNVSTVLYAVQRMAQLSALFTLLALLSYCGARAAIANGDRRTALVLLFVAFPALTLLGVLSKQNAAVAPALCLLIELAFPTVASWRQSRIIKVFYLLSLGLPIVGGVTLLAMSRFTFLADYANYDFTLGQRLLTQSRVLCDYIGQIYFPRTPLMGLYSDDFSLSTGLFQPITTFWSTLSLAAISIAALVTRKRTPFLFFGWFFFLIAHIVESSFLPLDIYFEHRNYLPALGLIFAAVGLIDQLLQGARTNVLTSQQLALLMGISVLAVSGYATLGRVLVWKDKQSIVDQGVKYHPHSLRAQLDRAGLASDRGDQRVHLEVMQTLAASQNSQHRLIGEIYLTAISCQVNQDADPSLLRKALRNAQPRLTFTETHAFNVLSYTLLKRGCGRITDSLAAEVISTFADSAGLQPDQMQPKWLARYAAAQLYARAQNWDAALKQARLAWQPNADPAIGALLAELQAKKGLFAESDATLQDAASRIKCRDQKNLKGLGELWFGIEQLRATQLAAPPRDLPSFNCRQW